MRPHQQPGRADLHMHTTASDGLPTIEKLLEYVTTKRTNLDVIAITDHDTLDASLWAYEHRRQYPFDIVPGEEVSSAEGHVLALWIRKPIEKGLSLAETAAAIHRQGGIAILAHPFHIHLREVLRSFRRYLRNPEYLIEAGIDGLETHNAGIVFPGCNRMARRLARKLGMAVTGSSDAHSLGAIGSGITRFPGHTAADLRLALETCQTIAQGKPWPVEDYLKVLRAASPLAATH